MSLFDAFFAGLIEWLALRKVRLRVAYGYNREPARPLTISVQLTNRSRRPVKVTRIWLATNPEVEIFRRDEPDIVSPTGTLHVGVHAARIPHHGDMTSLGRAQLADGRIITSR